MSLRLRELMAQMEVEGETIERTEHESIEWQKILKRWPQIRDIEANFRVVQGACHPMDVTADSVALLLDADSSPQSLVHDLSLAEPEAIKRELIDKIAEHLAELTSAPGAVQHRKKLMQFWTLENLRRELLRVESVADLQDKSTSELREIARQGRPSVPHYPELPRKIMVHGEMVKLDPAHIKRLDREDLKKLIRIYGADSVNSRLRGE
jgi:hypothetical protein